MTKSDQSMDMVDKLAAVKTECEVEFSGSTVFKDISVMVRPVECLLYALLSVHLFRDFLVTF